MKYLHSLCYKKETICQQGRAHCPALLQHVLSFPLQTSSNSIYNMDTVRKEAHLWPLSIDIIACTESWLNPNTLQYRTLWQFKFCFFAVIDTFRTVQNKHGGGVLILVWYKYSFQICDKIILMVICIYLLALGLDTVNIQMYYFPLIQVLLLLVYLLSNRQGAWSLEKSSIAII